MLFACLVEREYIDGWSIGSPQRYGLCLQVAFMSVGHIASKFAQNFTLKTEVGRLHCCLQVTLSIAILTQNKLHSPALQPSVCVLCTVWLHTCTCSWLV